MIKIIILYIFSCIQELRFQRIIKIIFYLACQFKIPLKLVILFIYLFLINLFILFIYFWLRWVFIAAYGLPLAVASGGYSSLRCVGFSLQWLLVAEHRLQAHGLQQLWCMGSVDVARRLQTAGSVVVAHGLSCSVACGIFPDQAQNPCPLHWQADS